MWRMNTKHPEGLSLDIVAVAMPIRDELVAARWTFGTIHWDSERQRRLAFSAKPPSGKSIYVACEDHNLVRKLLELSNLPR